MHDSRERPTALRAMSSLIAVGFCVIALAELGIGRPDWLLRAVPRGDLSLLSFALDEAVVEPNPDARILILGTSRARGAFLPTVMESKLGLERGQVVNLAIGGVHVQESAWLYDQARKTLSHARTLVLQVDPFSFSGSRPITDRQCEWMSWSDRAALGGLRAAQAFACGVFQLQHRRPLLRWWITTWLGKHRAPAQVELDRYGRAAMVRIADDHVPEEFSPERFRYWLDYYYRGFVWSPVYERHFLDLVRLARADGVEVIVVHLPVVPGYLDAARALPGRPYQQFEERLPALVDGLARVQIWERPEELGLRFRDFRDWGHLNTPGAERLSVAFSAWMKGGAS